MAWEWGDGAGLIGGAAGVVEAVIAWASLLKARDANTIAKQGLESSRKANEIADAAVISRFGVSGGESQLGWLGCCATRLVSGCSRAVVR
ncbi:MULTISPECIES: hypothetical protein [unclassified Streptomyces]|uniref:hypothetical protein n=1 Tax=unclassified Streptomyces TaxID=2593676 RepID=UPI0011AFEF23|nr:MULTISPECIES: hypothetical protein [unclassified Streptomyces]